MAFKLIQTGINFTIVELLGAFANRFEQQGFRIKFRVNTQNIQHDTGRSAIIPATNNVTIADDKHKLALVVIVERCKRIDRPT